MLHRIRKKIAHRICNFLAQNSDVPNYSATSNNMKLVQWPLIGGLHLVQWGGDCAGSQAPPRCTKCNSPPINGQCTNHCTAVWF